MSLYENNLTWFEQYDTLVLGISVDSIPFKVERGNSLGGISYDLLSDFFPHGGVAELYGVARSDGLSERPTFLINKRGFIVLCAYL